MNASLSVPQELDRQAAEVPLQYVNITANSEVGGRDSGLLLTRADIFKIKKYERTALGLPTTLPDIIQLLGFSKSGIDGLEPEQLLATYQKLRQHGVSWGGLEESVKRTSTSLYTFASDFLVTGKRMLEVFGKMGIIEQLNQAVRDAKLGDGVDLGPIALSDEDTRIRDKGLAKLLERMATLIGKQLDSVDEVKQEISDFADDIKTRLIPEVGRKIELSHKHKLDQRLETLKVEVTDLTHEIGLKKKEYDELVKQALSGSSGGVIGLVVTGGIFGAQAETVRKERNQMIIERDAKVAEVKSMSPLITAVGRLAGDLDNLDMSLQDAEVGASNLRDMWGTMELWVSESLKRLRAIDDSQTLFDFMTMFESVVTPWEDIKKTSNYLNITLIHALNDWNSENHA
ncbi:alpha-xenorhabdolysin family binary toxin subunit A [Pseudomonas putida]